MRWFVLLVAFSLLGGCVKVWGQSRDLHVLEGEVDNGTLSVIPIFDRTRDELTVRVNGTIIAAATEGLAVDVYLAAKPCSEYGPPGTPETPVDHETIRIDDPKSNSTIPFGATLATSTRGGQVFQVYARPHAANAIGPIFGLCRDVAT